MRRLIWKHAFGKGCCRFSTIPPITTHYSQTKAKADVEFQLAKTGVGVEKVGAVFGRLGFEPGI